MPGSNLLEPQWLRNCSNAIPYLGKLPAGLFLGPAGLFLGPAGLVLGPAGLFLGPAGLFLGPALTPREINRGCPGGAGSPPREIDRGWLKGV